MHKFTTTGSCVPEKHYMVNTQNKLEKINKLVDDEQYFSINRARQYGKTTILHLLTKELSKDYMCLFMSFENAGQTMFESVADFCQRFLWQIEMIMEDFYPEQMGLWQDESVNDFDLLGRHLNKLCKAKKIVLIIDEIDRASNYRVFLMFLSMLRDKYLDRNRGTGATFHSVILAGVTDVKNLKFKMETEGLHIRKEGEGISASPWNIAVNFKVDMSFNASEIETMLKQYEDEHSTGMNTKDISKEIYQYTSGYPFMVSRICQIIDEDLGQDWTTNGVREAVKVLLEEKNTLFDDMSKNLENYTDLREFVRSVLIDGVAKPFSTDDVCIDFGFMLGYFKNVDSKVVITNKIYEIRLSNYFILREGRTSRQITGIVKEDVIRNGRFDMKLCLEKFAKHYHEIFSERDVEFLERHGRMLFLSYLKPLINGIGFYHIESELRNEKRMDIVVDYGNEQFIVELKRWYGDTAHRNAFEQLLDYMKIKNIKEGYLLTFDFSKNPKLYEPRWEEFDGKRIFSVKVD